MATSLTIELHRTDLGQLCSVLPFDTSNLCRALEPLPLWCATGPYPFVSQRALPLLRELSQTVPTSPSVGVHREGPLPCLTDIFNLTLLTVVDIRSLYKCNESPHSALPFVLGLIRVLARICVADSAVLADVPFARPRVAPSQCGLDRLHGVAIMLACHVVEGCAKEPVPGASSSSRASASSKSSLFYSLDEDSECDASNADIRSLDVPLEAHILPGFGRMHKSAHLPFLCVADSDNIIGLMASVACQRYVWGFEQPAVGFAMSATGLRASLVLSWVDPITNIVHVAHPPSDNKGGIPGVFDFTNAASTLAFAHLVLKFSSTFSTTSCKGRIFNWRSDMAPILSGNFSNSWDRVEQWVRDIKALSFEVDNISRTQVDIGIDVEEDSAPYLCDGEKAANSKAHPISYPTEPPSCIAEREHDYHPWQWAFDRRVQFLACTSLELPNSMKEGARAEVIEINEMVRVYDRMCESRWCISWESDCRPPVDAALVRVRDMMVEQATQARHFSTTVQLSLEAEHADFLAERMPAVLLSLLTLKTSARALEASRYDWDRLIYSFYLQPDVQPDEYISPRIISHPNIHLARNELADLLSLDSTSFGDIAMAHVRSTITLGLYSVDATPLDDEQAYAQETEALDNSVVFKCQLRRMLETEIAQYQHSIRDRSSDEPEVGRCDAMLVCDGISVPTDLIKDTVFILGTESAPGDSSTSPLQIDPERRSRTCSSAVRLLLPHAVLDYGNVSKFTRETMDDGRMALISLVAFYSSLGITDRPFYHLSTTGTVCGILMAWKSSSQQKTYLIERKIRKFDLGSPVDALQFAAFLLRLRDDEKQLKHLVMAKLKDGLDPQRLQQWKKSAQCDAGKN
ncbi:hypothetical protein DFH06DRAFT_1204279 [Mycena polygramma]|nr:hypothetical protein DFH06DRAFT_1204279 [Mycena polygramma]